MRQRGYFVSVLRQSLLWLVAFVALSWNPAECQHTAAASDNPFDVKDVAFDSTGTSLSGRLFAPRRHNSKYPVAIYVTGSGDDDVNEGGYPRALAKVFATSGVGLFTYNKRGIGKSQGTLSETNFAQRAQDTVAAFRYVKSLPGVDARHVGLWGISQGGWVIAMAAGRAEGIDFVVLVSPAGVNPKRQVEFYLQNEWRSAGMTEDEIKAATALHEILFQYFSNGKTYEQAQSAVDIAQRNGWLAKYRQAGFREEVPKTGRLPSPEELETLDKKDPTELELYRSPSTVADYYEHYLRLKMPALIIYGGRDTLVPVPESMGIFKKAFAQNQNRRAEFKMFEEGDHSIQPPGSPYLLSGYPEFMCDWMWKTISMQDKNVAPPK